MRKIVLLLVLSCARAWIHGVGCSQARRLHVRRGAAETRDIHTVGLEFKSRGLEYRDLIKQNEQKRKKVGYAALATVNFALFTMYRAYRGFFVILPAVFVEVRNKLERKEIKSIDVAEDLDPKTGKLKMRSTILMNLGAAIFTAVIVLRSAVGAIFLLLNAIIRRLRLKT